MPTADMFIAVGNAFPWAAPLLGGLLGAVAGSFITCAITRLPTGQSLWNPPSKCDGCNRTLTAIDLIPIVSWLIFQGRCRTCRSPIGVKMLVIEIVSCAVGAVMGGMIGLVWFTLPMMVAGLGVYAGLMVGLLTRR